MEQKIKNYLHEQMENFDENKVLVLKGWVVLGMVSKDGLKDYGRVGDAIGIVMYDDKKRIFRTEPFFNDNEDIEETCDDIISYLESEFGIEL